MTDKERRFWEAVGFRQVKGVWQTPWIDFKYSDSRYRYECPEGLPDINSLDDLVKWAVPKIYYLEIKVAKFHKYQSVMVQLTRDSEPKYAQDENVTAALYEALCKALEVER